MTKWLYVTDEVDHEPVSHVVPVELDADGEPLPVSGHKLAPDCDCNPRVEPWSHPIYVHRYPA